MKNDNKRPLHLIKLWLALGWLLTLVVIYLSLTPSPPPAPGIPHGDKLGHFLVYAGLMGWFVQIYVGRASRALLAIGFITMGAMLEVLQGLGGARMFDWWDMAANAAGVLAALSLADTRMSELLLRTERRWFVPATGAPR